MPLSWRRRLLLRDALFCVVAFTGAIYFYYLVATWGLQDHLADGPVRDYLTRPAVHVQQVLAGVMLGVLLALVNRLTNKVWLRSRSLGRVILLRTALYVVGLAIVFASVSLLFLLTGVLTLEAYLLLLGDFSPRYLLSIVTFLVLASVGVNFLLEIRSMVAGGNLWHLVTGHYRRPRDEVRVFLFMDLVGSTSIAEKLGHERYSQFIQQCFSDLTGVALDCDGTIYQYVGDEVVLTWPAAAQESRRSSLRAFFAYESVLASRRAWYEERFGMAPRFRGGIDVGSVTATEVGEVKRDIVYHGDVLNTAARLLELCKERGGRLLVSDRVGEGTIAESGVTVGWQEEVTVRGKEVPTRVFSLESAPGTT